jgi:hypothetical protein
MSLKLSHISKLLVIVMSIGVISAMYLLIPSTSVFFTNASEEKLKNEIEAIYNTRNMAFITGDLNSIKPAFDISQKYGEWSLEHEVRRVKYLRSWSKQRGVKFINIESFIRIKKNSNIGGNVKLSLEESYKFDYIYPSDPAYVINSFGIGIRHTLTLVKKGENNIIYSDQYTDCFEDAMGSYSGEIENSKVFLDYEKSSEIYSKKTASTKLFYNRYRAVEYADKYCGAAWGSKNDFKYNNKYTDYNGLGGDCTNFTSQVLGDMEAGGISQNGEWFSKGKKNEQKFGTRAWVNVDGLKNYLLYSGKGSQLKKGTFKELTMPTHGYPNGIISKLNPGDLICYEKKSNPDHFGIITGFDSHGYPLVDTHTTDRYHVPWDLGWSDNKIKFILIHING